MESEASETSTGLPSELEQVLGDVQLWLSLAERLGFDRTVYQVDMIPSLDTLSRYFDSSERGLLRVFHLFDKDNDELLTFEEISRGLRQQGLYQNSESSTGQEAFTEICNLTQSAGRVHPPEFLWTLRNLRLAALMHGYLRCGMTADELLIQLHEYREDRILSRCPIDAPVSFLFQPSAEVTLGMRVRWLHCHDAPRLAVLGLAIKYGVDPRFVLDIFNLWREPARTDTVRSSLKGSVSDSTQLFTILPVLRLTQRSEDSCRPYESWRRLKRAGQGRRSMPPCVVAEVEHCNLAMLMVGDQDKATVLSFTSEWCRLSKMITDQMYEDVDVESKISGTSSIGPLSAFRRILATLNTSYSHLRTGDAQTLVLKTLCEITEDYLAISKAYDYGLNILQKRLDRQRDAMSLDDVRKIRKSVRQLSHLYRLVSPVLAVIDSLSNIRWSGEAQLYLSDIRGNVSRFLDDTIAHRELARGMIDQFQNFCESKTSQILYLLTRVTTLCVPGQFLASVYGMNFADENGVTTIPELKWKYGYAFYWAVVITLTSIIFVLTRRV